MLYAHQNPFASHRIESLVFEPQGTHWSDILSRLEHLHYRACILGQQGSGKTTFLEHLSNVLLTHGKRVHLHPRHGVLPLKELLTLPQESILLFDGADTLSRPALTAMLTLSRRLSGLILVSHERLLLPELLTCTTSPKLFANLCAQLLSTFPGQITLPDPAAQLRDHSGNIRAAFRECYEISAREGALSTDAPLV